MAKPSSAARDFSALDVRPALRRELTRVSSTCINCKLCIKECEFLRSTGKPKEIADGYDPTDPKHRYLPFECSLCRLCQSVCPVGVNPAALFLEMRKESLARNGAANGRYDSLLTYEQRGISRLYSYYALPAGCDQVFFPGCTLPGTRPHSTLNLFRILQQRNPAVGLVLDCCTKISHDLGREAYFLKMFEQLKRFLLARGVREVLVACPNCHKVFRTHGGELKVRTVYEVLGENGWVPPQAPPGTVVTVHDPCGVRFQTGVHDSVRRLLRSQGLKVEEMPHRGEKTLCCGEGGAVSAVNPKLAAHWVEIRRREAEDRRIISYCAGCVGFLKPATPAGHLLDLLFDPGAALAGTEKISRAPFTYLNRILLKRRLRRIVPAAVSGSGLRS